MSKQQFPIPQNLHLKRELKEKLSPMDAYQKVAFSNVQYHKAQKVYNDTTKDIEILLFQTYFICSNCFRKFDYCEADVELYEAKVNEFYDWANQLNICDMQEEQDDVFYFIGSKLEKSKQECTFCYMEGDTEERIERYIEIDSNSHRTKIEMARPYASKCGDSIVFEHETGELKRFTNCYRNEIEDIEIVFANDTEIKQALFDIFDAQYSNLHEFEYDSMTLYTFIWLNKFNNFPASFYKKIPFKIWHSYELENSFDEIACQMKDYKMLKNLYQKYELPAVKEIEELFLNNPAFFFYIEEVKRLPFQSIKQLFVFLSSFCAYRVLAMLHRNPRAVEFIEALLEKYGEKAWCIIGESGIGRKDDFVDAIRAFFNCAKDKRKGCITGSLKESIEALKKYDEYSIGQPFFNYPVVRHEINYTKSLKGYQFILVEHTNDYEYIVEHYFSYASNNVYMGVMQDDRFIAVMEIVGRMAMCEKILDRDYYCYFGFDDVLTEWANENDLIYVDVENERDLIY